MPLLSYSHALDLKRHLQGTQAEVITIDSEEYPENISRFSDASEKEAGAVVRVSSADEVAKVLGFVTQRYIPLAIHAGGYSTGGASSTHGGVILSLANMQKVQVDSIAQTVTVQGGSIWKDVDIAAAQYGLAVVGPTINQVGVGGSTLGGGYGWLTGRHGLIIDNLLSVTMVLADGCVAVASETQNKDLFWAVRGAGQAFGVATEFTFRAYPQQNPVFGGPLYFTADKLEKVVDFVNRFEDLNDGNQGLLFGFAATPGGPETSVVAMTFYNGSQNAAEQFFEPLLSLDPIVNETGMIPYHKINSMFNRAATPGVRKRLSGSNVTLPVNADFVKEIYADFCNIMRTYSGTRDSAVMFELLPYNEIIKIPNDATACANRGRYYNVGSIFCWLDAAMDRKMASEQQTMMKNISERAGIVKHEGDGQGVGIYANYVGHEARAQDLFGDNLLRIQELKKRYDPKNVFRKWHDMHLYMMSGA